MEISFNHMSIVEVNIELFDDWSSRKVLEAGDFSR